jgi:hypothetical protein
MGNTKWLALALASVVGGACSDGPKNVAPTPLERATLDHVAAAGTTLSATPDVGTASGPNSPDQSYAVAIPMKPWTECTIYPEGASGDPVHTNTIKADASGEVRFYPPQDWGTRLSLDCTLNGSSQGSHLVDLSDASTFKRESESDLIPHVERVLPALAGDPMAPSLKELLKQGYPPRPDPQRSRARYQHWLQAVSTPAQVYSSMPVSKVGDSFNYFWGENANYGWTGFVQSNSAFDPSPPIKATYNGTVYEEYMAEMGVPGFSNGQACSNCSTGIWAGTGGVKIDLTQFGFGVQPTDLFQSGFALNNKSNKGQPFYEFVAVGNESAVYPPVPQADQYSAGDEFIVWGWQASDSSCDLTSSDAQYACFGFWDLTANPNWVLVGLKLPISAGIYLPVTVEYIAEAPTGRNASYGFDFFEGGADDTNGVEHLDPGGDSAGGPLDYWAYVEQDDPSGNPYSIGAWGNNSWRTNTPQDPIWLQFQNSQ